ncbi:MAG: DNA-binding domain-containing protein [Bdellovibrionota bacterium]
MNSLKKLQLQFKEAITKNFEPEFLNSLPLRETAQFSKLQRLKVYQNAYFLRIEESLEEDFPETFELIKKTKGDLRSQLRKFLKENPSKFNNLGEYSQSFPLFFDVKNERDLYESANFEWKKCITFAAHHKIPVDISTLSQYSEEEILTLKMELHPAVQLAIKGDHLYLLYRADSEVTTDKIDLNSYKIIDMILEGLNISKIVERISSPEELFRIFAMLSSRGLIVGIQK